MSTININTVSGGNNIFGDNNTITNNFATDNKVLTRDDYFQIILELRNLERISLGDYLEDKFQKLCAKNPDFIKILYKDIYRVLDGVLDEGEGDLVCENGDFAIEYGDIKLSGQPNNLHYVLTWLHVKVVEEFSKEPSNLFNKLQNFEKDFLYINYDTPEYSQRLKELNTQLKSEKKSKNKSGLRWTDFNEIFELKPNLFGLGVNINAILERLFKRKK